MKIRQHLVTTVSPSSTTATSPHAAEQPVLEPNHKLTVGTQLIEVTASASNENAAELSGTFATAQNNITS